MPVLPKKHPVIFGKFIHILLCIAISVSLSFISQPGVVYADPTQPQTITFDTNPPPNPVYGGDYTPSATASSTLLVTITIDPSSNTVCSILGGIVSFIGTGSCVINADQGGDDGFLPAPQIQQIFYIGPAPLTITADSTSKIYGDNNPIFTATIDGIVNGDTIDYTLATTADGFSGVGDYPITVSLGSNPNYDITPIDGNLHVSPKAATVTADSINKTYGDNNPTLTAIVDGEVEGGDVVDFTLSTTAGILSSVGNYPITVTLGSNPNYDITPIDGNLHVGSKAATVTADNKTKIYGDDNPALTAAVAGTVNGDILSYTLATTAVKDSNVGSYPIAVTLNTNPNYTVTPTDGILSITKAGQAISFTSTPPTNAVVRGTYTPTAGGGLSGNPVTFAIDAPSSSICSISAGTVTFQSAGNCVINASQAGNGNYFAAPQAKQSITVYDPTLSSLSIKDWSISPTFSRFGYSGYTTTVGLSSSAIVISAQRSESHSTVRVKSDITPFVTLDPGGNSTPLSLYIGTNTITIEVTALDGPKQNYTITVTRLNQNRPPTRCWNQSLTTIVVGHEYKETLCANDPDQDPVTFSTGPLPAWLHLINENGTISLKGTPGMSDIGSVPVTVYFTDEPGNVNVPPVSYFFIFNVSSEYSIYLPLTLKLQSQQH